MIYYSIIATITAVALGLALNAVRAQVRGLARELKKKVSENEKQRVQIWDLTAEVNGEKDKAKTWEHRGQVAERDLRAALDQLFVLTEKAAKRREYNRINKAKSRARKKAQAL